MHLKIQILSYLFIKNQPKVTCSFQFLIFQESFYMVHVFTSTYHYFYPVSHFETAIMGSTTFKVRDGDKNRESCIKWEVQ